MSDSEPAAPKEMSWNMRPIKAITEGIKQFGRHDVWMQLRQCKEVKLGTHVGTDQNGNRYYENKDEQFGKDRWVVYNTVQQHMDYDPGTVTAEWHGWLHHMYDEVPQTSKKYQAVVAFDDKVKTGRDTSYKNPGAFIGGKSRGDGYSVKTGSARPPFTAWDPTNPTGA
uniref:NADH dehydrogenase [ubiquinone] 1 alpha subcomplex subunit 12 n=1 Tax=Hemiselmis andersenii TaxID=464988 RepID=A0A7S1HGH3_HEMAN|mmetsp:Transcript_58167/g.140220  ORF Transcript_58167/g.140220 Transcript_58167/m.140220 type:complete len:168 (+) Transcript_58167:100-603(+)